MTAPLIEFREARFGYRSKIVLERVSIDVRRGDLLGLVGPNGAGKTTLLRGLLGELAPLGGSVIWSEGKKPRFGFVPQRENLNPIWPLSVLDVVLMGRCVRRGPFRRYSVEDIAESKAALESAGIPHLESASVSDLSGGQVQRALLARALAAQPELLVLDEPTTGLDLAGSTAMLRLIRELHDERRLTVIVVSHDLNAVAAIANRFILLHEGVIREGDAASILSPEVLGAVYGLDLEVCEIAGRRIVTTRNEGGFL
jgi:ABC-type Mn2+/Zn2+ transport system ATPase subunit